MDVFCLSGFASICRISEAYVCHSTQVLMRSLVQLAKAKLELLHNAFQRGVSFILEKNRGVKFVQPQEQIQKLQLLLTG
jgi:hypothetical protein